MTTDVVTESITKVLGEDLGGGVRLANNYVSLLPDALANTQEQTQGAFSDKWAEMDQTGDAYVRQTEMQRAWYLELYGFTDEAELAAFLSTCDIVLDAGAGKAGKAAWFASLSPSTIVIAADISSSLADAASAFSHLENLAFVQCDIGQMPFFADGLFDYVSCDQVIHHTTNPPSTFKELVRITADTGQVSTYVYRRKALPRELLDDHFRDFSRELSHDQLMELSTQITETGRLLSELTQEIDFPAIPALGIDGGTMTAQRYLYWNFFKCYWNDEAGAENSLMTNYDWYAPSQASRYSEEEFRAWIDGAGLTYLHFHRELACFSGRFGR